MRIKTGPKQLEFAFDRLYRKIQFSPDDLRLFQTKELSRLRQVSLSAVPPWIIPAASPATRFEHSLGVAHLTKIVGRKKEFRDVAHDLYFAALAHDLGTPPFSHVSEYLLIKLLGKNHEEYLDEILPGSEFAKEIKRQGGQIRSVLALAQGKKKPFSDILNGTMDIDNLDNSLRFGLSTGILRRLPYSPESLAQSYVMRGSNLVILGEYEKEIRSWERTRDLVYEFVYGPANLPPGSMLLRALEFAAQEGEIKPEFFRLTDPEAYIYLEKKCNKRTRTLLARAREWQFYPRIFSLVTHKINARSRKVFGNFDNRSRFADELAKILKTEPENVCLYLGHNKGFKHIHLPIVGTKVKEYVPKIRPFFLAQVFVHPKLANRTEIVREFMEEKLNLRPKN